MKQNLFNKPGVDQDYTLVRTKERGRITIPSPKSVTTVSYFDCPYFHVTSLHSHKNSSSRKIINFSSLWLKHVPFLVTLWVMMTDNVVFIFSSSHDFTRLVQMSPVDLLGPGAPDMDSCFLWLATLLEAICLNMESLSPHSLIAHVLCLPTVCGFGLGKHQGNNTKLYL